MRYTIDERGIHYEVEDKEADAFAATVANDPPPIPLDEAVRAIEDIAAKQREALNAIGTNAAATVDTGTPAKPEPATAA